MINAMIMMMLTVITMMIMMIMMMLTVITMMIMLIMMMLTVITMMMAVDVLDCFQKHAPPSSQSPPSPMSRSS